MRRPYFFSLATTLVIFLFTGCGEELGLPGGEFASIYNSGTFQMCSDCHAPGAPGFVAGTETTQDWSTEQTAYASLKNGTAAGLIGNFAGCNGVDLIGSTPEASLLVAVFDETIRNNFDVAGFPNCDVDTIVDETLRVGTLSPSLLADLKQWITDGALAD